MILRSHGENNLLGGRDSVEIYHKLQSAGASRGGGIRTRLLGQLRLRFTRKDMANCFGSRRLERLFMSIKRNTPEKLTAFISYRDVCPSSEITISSSPRPESFPAALRSKHSTSTLLPQNLLLIYPDSPSPVMHPLLQFI